MKITKSHLRRLIKETLNEITQGALTGDLAAVAGSPEFPSADDMPDLPDFTLQTDETPDTIVQAHAIKFFMELGLKRKTCETIVANMAVSDLKVIMNQIPKIDTAAEGT